MKRILSAVIAALMFLPLQAHGETWRDWWDNLWGDEVTNIEQSSSQTNVQGDLNQGSVTSTSSQVTKVTQGSLSVTTSDQITIKNLEDLTTQIANSTKEMGDAIGLLARSLEENNQSTNEILQHIAENKPVFQIENASGTPFKIEHSNELNINYSTSTIEALQLQITEVTDTLKELELQVFNEIDARQLSSSTLAVLITNELTNMGYSGGGVGGGTTGTSTPVRVVEYAKQTGLSFSTTYSLDAGRTWQNLKDDYEFIEFHYEIDVTGVTEDVLRVVTIPTADLRDDTRWRFEYGSALVDLNPGPLTAGDFVMTGSTVDEIAVTIVGVAAQQRVVQPTTAIAQFDGTAVTGTLNQLSGTAWTVGTSTNPGTGAIILNTDFAHYLQEGNRRYYSIRLYQDYDPEITFEVIGAQDVALVEGVGNSLGSGDFAHRMIFVRRSGVNVISVNRDDDNNVDTFVDITFMAIM